MIFLNLLSNNKTYLIIAIFLAMIFSFCQEAKVQLDGTELARGYCASCHAYPDPQVLDQKTWSKYVLPRMGQFMGIYQNEKQRDSLLEKGSAAAYLEQNQIYPQAPQLSDEEWLAIQEFYLKNAPKKLDVDSLAIQQSSLFKARFPELFLSPPSTTFLSLREGQVLFADANKQAFYELDGNLKIQKQAKVGEALTHVQQIGTDYWLTVMGSFSPTDQGKGYLYQLRSKPDQPSEKIIHQLRRPVHSTYHDFNEDGRQDIVICEYGKWTGSLSLWIAQEKGGFVRQELINRPGAIATDILDINQDGLPDILALFGQGDEGFVLFTNQGNLKFKAQQLIRLHPSMGSSSFSLFDFNEDGLQDLVYTAGDNADYPPVVKPYHGIYVFLQTPNQQFEQELFLPFPGAYRAIPADYDLDGDMDLAAISFFPDYDRQGLDFVFFENQNQQFTPKTIALPQVGRWMVMDANDFDGDGDTDLALGSLAFEVPQNPKLVNQWVQNGLPFVLLENQVK